MRFSARCLGLILLILLPQLLVALPAPAPQEDSSSPSSTTSKPKRTTTTTEKSTDDDYVDAEVKKSGTKSKPVKKPIDEDEDSSSEEHFDIGEAFEDILEGAFGVFRHTLKTAGEVAHNLSIPEHVDGAIKTGLNITHKLVKLGEQAIENPEKVMKEKRNFLQALAKTMEETRPLIHAGADELGKHVNLGAAFAKAYGETWFNQADAFFKIFDNRLKCNNECKKMEEGSEERKTCEDKFCKEVPVERRKNDDDDDDDDATPVTRKKENLTKKKKEDPVEDSYDANVEEEEEKAKKNELPSDN